MAMQIVDIITLRPEIELCYMGLGTKCFEILENSSKRRESRSSSRGNSSGQSEDSDVDDGDLTDEEDDITDEEDDGSDEDVEDAMHSAASSAEELSDSESGGGWFGFGKKPPKLRLQEILFYDKISIFKARYGRL
jgi:hypothetical protein